MRDEIMRLAERMTARSEDCAEAKDAIALQEFATELRALARTDHVEDKLGMVPEGWQLVPIKATPAMLNAFPSNFGAAIRYAEILAVAPKPPNHSAGVGGMVIDDAMLKRASRARCVFHGWDPDGRVTYSGTKNFVRNRDGSFVLQWEFGIDEIRAAVIAALAQPADADAEGGK